ncbi:MAG: DNA polymerase III subunit gamma/tau, partial [Candidatus Omnitrophota bacterium]
QGRSLDVIEIDGASNRGIDEIRALRENVKFSPTSGKFKVYIIDEVHQITPDGFNALLKTLEEPPEFVKFIFATTHPHKIMPTILSRCQRLDFRRISVVEIIAQLERIVKAEKISVDKEVLFAIAKASDGSLRDAESILDQLVSFSKDNISLKDVVSVLGLVEQDAFFALVDRMIKKDPHAALTIFNKLMDSGKDTGVFLANLIEHFRNLMVARVTKADMKIIDLPQEACDRYLKQSQAFSLEELFVDFNILVNTQEMAKRLNSLRIPIEIALVSLSCDKSQAAIPQKPAAKKQEHLPQAQPSESAAIEEEQIQKISAEDDQFMQEISIDAVKNIWQKLIDKLAGIKMSVSSYLNEGELLNVHGNIIVISFPKNYSLHKETLEEKDNKDLVEKVASELSNSKLKVNFVLSKEDKQDQAEVRANPFVKSAIEMFGARVVREE